MIASLCINTMNVGSTECHVCFFWLNWNTSSCRIYACFCFRKIELSFLLFIFNMQWQHIESNEDICTVSRRARRVCTLRNLNWDEEHWGQSLLREQEPRFMRWWLQLENPHGMFPHLLYCLTSSVPLLCYLFSCSAASALSVKLSNGLLKITQITFQKIVLFFTLISSAVFGCREVNADAIHTGLPVTASILPKYRYKITM